MTVDADLNFAVAAAPDADGPAAPAVAGLRLYIRTAVTPQWLSRSIVPTARAMARDHGASLVYLRRGWLHGPHVDLIARHGQGAPPPWSQIAASLDPGPVSAADILSEEAYLAQAREFGRLERVAPPYLPMRAHGEVDLLTPADVEVWPQPLDSLRELALGRIFRPLLRTIEEFAADRANATARVAEAFIAIADAHHSGAAFGAFSLRSHSEAFMAWASPRKDPRPAFAQRLERDAPLLRTLVEQALREEVGATAAGWRNAFAYCMGVFDSAVADGTLTLAKLETLAGEFDPETMGPPGADGRAGAEPSAFHEAVSSSGVIEDVPEWFASYRVLINLFYQQLPLLGVSPMHRYYLCYAIAQTIDEVLGTSWLDRLGVAAAKAVR